jgi:hypothetical protein
MLTKGALAAQRVMHLLVLGPRGHDHHERSIDGQSRDRHQRIDQSGVGPVQVLHDQQRGAVHRRAFHQQSQGSMPEAAPALLIRGVHQAALSRSDRRVSQFVQEGEQPGFDRGPGNHPLDRGGAAVR